MADKRPDVYREDGRWVFRASSFGACDGALVRSAVGMLPNAKPDWLQAAMNQSAEHEAPILKAITSWKMLDGLVLEQYGAVGSDGQIEAELDVAGNTGGVIRCHPDGIAQCFKAKLDGSSGYEVGDRAVVEVKAMKGPDRDVLAGSEFYRWQTSIEMAVTGLPLLFITGWKTEDGKLRRTDDGKLGLTVAYLTEPYYTVAQIKARVRKLTRMIDAYDNGEGLPACTWKMFPCGYWQDHDTTTGIWKEQMTEIRGAEAAKIRRYAKLWVDAKGREEEAKAARVELGAKILELTGNAEGKIDAGQGVRFTKVVKAGSKRLDKAKVQEAGIDLEPYYTTGEPTEYIDKVEID